MNKGQTTILKPKCISKYVPSKASRKKYPFTLMRFAVSTYENLLKGLN